MVKAILDAILPLSGHLPLALHLHDTRGLGLVNLMAALEHGVSMFDTAFAGMGGCPFVAGAAGNIATEDTAHLLETLGIHTGVDYHRVGAVSREMEAFFQKSFPACDAAAREFPAASPVGPLPPRCYLSSNLPHIGGSHGHSRFPHR